MESKVDRKGRATTRKRPGDRRRSSSIPADAWEHLGREIAACTRCSLHRTRTQVVIYRGSRHPRIVFVGEAPGAEEDRQGIPFVGRSGQRLDAAIASMEIPSEEYGILNLVKCRPPRNRFDAQAEQTCRPFLDRQLALLDPHVLVSLGAHALAALDPSAPRVLLAAGRPRPLQDRTLFPLLHPAAALRSNRMAERWSSDVARLGAWLAGSDGGVPRERL